MSLNNDRLVFNKGREDNKINIPLVLESTDSKKILQEEKVNGVCSDDNHVCVCGR